MHGQNHIKFVFVSVIINLMVSFVRYSKLRINPFIHSAVRLKNGSIASSKLRPSAASFNSWP